MQPTRFSGYLITVMTMAGVAIGLGNVWRFPYMMGQYGGSAFLLIYLGFMFLIAVPALCAEWALGRHTRAGTIGAFIDAFGKPAGTALGVLLVVGILIADSYYMVVIGNILYSTVYAGAWGFGAEAGGAAVQRYADGLGHGHLQYLCALVILAGGLWVVARGLKRGIEAVSRWFVPYFGLVILYLVAYSLSLDGAIERMVAFLKPDFSRIGSAELFAALGQACFSLGIGGTFMVIYGSFLKRDQPLVGTAVATGISDTSAALLAGLFIVPAVLVFGLDLAAGPGLIFNTLPQLFASMPGGRWIGLLFFSALTLMAFLSAVAGLQVCFAGARQLLGERWSDARLLTIIALAEVALMYPSATSPSLIGVLDLIFGSGMQVFGAALAVIGLTWGLRKIAPDALAGERAAYSPALLLWLRWVVPAALLAILIGYIHSAITG